MERRSTRKRLKIKVEKPNVRRAIVPVVRIWRTCKPNDRFAKRLTNFSNAFFCSYLRGHYSKRLRPSVYTLYPCGLNARVTYIFIVRRCTIRGTCWRDACTVADVLRRCLLVSARIYMLNRVSFTIGNGLLRSNAAVDDNKNGDGGKKNADGGHNKNVYRTNAIKINLLYIDELQWALRLDGTDLSRRNRKKHATAAYYRRPCAAR